MLIGELFTSVQAFKHSCHEYEPFGLIPGGDNLLCICIAKAICVKKTSDTRPLSFTNTIWPWPFSLWPPDAGPDLRGSPMLRRPEGDQLQLRLHRGAGNVRRSVL